MTSKIITISFDADKWTSSRALRYVKKMGCNPIKRCTRSQSRLIYKIKNPEAYEDHKKIVLDKTRDVRAVCGVKITKSEESEPEIPEDIPTTAECEIETEDVCEEPHE